MSSFARETYFTAPVKHVVIMIDADAYPGRIMPLPWWTPLAHGLLHIEYRKDYAEYM